MMQFWLVVSPTKTRALVVLLLAGFLSREPIYYDLFDISPSASLPGAHHH